jgi:TrpR-related protein YerC/YecD
MSDQVSHHWRTPEIRDLLQTIVEVRNLDEAERFFRDLCTLAELNAMAHRWQVAKLLDEGWTYVDVAQEARASTATVTRVAQWLRHGEGGYRLALDRRKRRARQTV